MIWTNKGLKQRVAELESEVSSLNLQVKELKFEEQASIDLINTQHEYIAGLEKKVESLSKTSPNVVVPPQTPVVEKLSVGKRIALSLVGKKP